MSIFARRWALSWANSRKRRRSARPWLLTLEGRIAPATWVAQGPGPTINAQVVVNPDNNINGAIQAIAPHPTNANILYAGTVNGGIWKSTNSNSVTPTWTPLTDNMRSLSIGDIQFDLSDATSNTLIVGTGRVSNFYGIGDDEIGLYYTTNGGATFTNFNDPLLRNQTILSVGARGSTLLAGSTSAGLFRSTNTGSTWANVSGKSGLSAGGIVDLVDDPTNLNRFYVAVNQVGVFRTTDAGANWTNVTAGLSGVAGSPRVRLAVNASAGVLYAAVTAPGANAATAVFRSTNQGGTWTALDSFDVHPGGQQFINTSLAAHPTNVNFAYLGGDRNTSNNMANLARVDASQPSGSGSQWISIVNANADNTTPHADSRNMAFTANGVLLECSDGGVYGLSNPAITGGSWRSVGGNIQAMEVHDVAWNAVNNTIVIGTQDNGTHQQPTSGSLTWNWFNGGDGGDVAVDSVSLASSNQAIRYYSIQNLGGFSRQVVDFNNNPVGSAVSLAGITNAPFVTPIEINTINPNRLLIGGGSALFESTDQGTSNTNIGGPGVGENAMVYGGRLAGVPNEELIYVGAGGRVFKRTTAGGAITITTAFPGGAGTITDVAINPDNYNTVFAVDSDQVFSSIDGGTTWLDITANLGIVSPGLDIRTVTYVQGKGGYASYVAIGTRSGVFAASNWRAPETFDIWTGIRTGLPDVLVYDLIYNATDDILVAGTLGRSVWTLSSASIEVAPSLMVNTDSDALDANDGLTTLREAVNNANFLAFANTITFSNLFSTPRTITLTNGEIPISDALTINAPGAGLLTISGNNNSRIFNTDPAFTAANVTIRGVTLTAGKSSDGGAINVGNENLTIEDSVILLCSSSGDGGAINVQNAGTLNLLRCTVTGNTALDDGGGIYINNGGSVDIIESALINNQATNGLGGGLYFFGTVASGGLRSLSSTIAGNSSGVGGGGIALVNFTGDLLVVNSTVTGNLTTTSSGGGIVRVSGPGTITLVSSIVSNNTGSVVPDIFSSGTVYAEYSAIGSLSGFTLTGPNNITGQNLKLRPVANNGGPTPSVAFEFDSPLRGKGTPPGPFTSKTDQRGLPRDANGVDIGAFELQTTVVNTNNSGLGSLRDAIAESDRVVGTDVINFGSLFNNVQIINLQTGEIAPTDAVTIQGKGESLTVINALGISRILNTTGVAGGKTVTLRGLRLSAGKATGDGGAILTDDELLVIEDASIHSSNATGSGGAISVGPTGKLTLNRSSLIGNTSKDLGGAIQFINGGNSEIHSSALLDNKSGIGGAIHLSGAGSNVTVINSTLSGNSAVFGGGIALAGFNGALTVRNTTITGNTSSSSGGGIDSYTGAPNINIGSTIVSGNSAPTGPDISSTSTITVNKSAIGSAAGFTLTGSNNLPFGTNLKLGSLLNNGGNTLTYLPANDSPLVNAGSNPANLVTDQRGVVRTLFGATDIGSVESATEPPDTTAPTITMITSTTGNGTYGVGTPINIALVFSESVTLTGTVNVTLDTGAVVSIVGPITADTLNGTYTVAAGQKSPDLNVTAIALTGGSTLRDAASNNATLTLPVSNLAVNKDIVISTPDMTAPTITSITSPTPNGTYGAGANIGVSLNFSEPVTLSGFLFIFLDSGGSLLIQGPQTGTTLSGVYNVGFNQNSPDLNVTAVQLDLGASLRDADTNNAVLTLPGSNLANNSNIVISTPATPTFIVTNTNDSGAGSLRQAVSDANNTAGFQNIVFNSSFNTAKTITLTTGELSILDGVSITGPGANLLTISGNNASRVFNVASGSAVTISGVGVTGGQASSGGGIFLGANRPPLTLVDVRIFNNSATNQGGGFWAGDSSNFTITRSTISGNTAGTSGGGFYAQFSSSTISDSAIFNNTSNFATGGGFFSYSGLTVTNCTISGNSAAGLGAGIATGGIVIRNSTITNNKGSGGGGVARTFGGGSITIDSAIVSGNTGGDIASGGTVNVNFSAIGSNSGFTPTGANNLAFGADLKLGALANNGGSTLTHALLAGSPAINKGSNPASLANDQRGPGFARVSGGTVDIGAYELFISPLIVLNANDSGANSLRDAIAFANSNPGADTITFDAAFFSTPRTITMGGTQMVFSDTTGATTVTGPGLSLVTVTGNNLSRVFLVNTGVTVALTGMTIAGGNATDGGGISNIGTLTIGNSRFTANTSGDGGAIRNIGTLNVSNTTFDANTANTGNGFGGAIATFNTMTVAACTFSANQSSVLGGAIVANGDATISDSTFTNNTSAFGGALRFHGTVTVTGSTLGGNSAFDIGGGIANYGTLNVNNSKLNSNTAGNGGGAIANFGNFSFGTGMVADNTAIAGGGMLLTGTVAINDSQFTNNKADYGGAIKNDSTITISNTNFDQNAAVTGDGFGGAIWNNAPLTIIGTTFTSNSSKTLGGAINSFQDLNISNSTFNNNTSALNGGALRLVGATVITGSTFNGNIAANDGGAIMSHGTTTITNSTLASNTASIGGGIYFFEGAGTLRNVTVAYNTATNTTGNFGGGTHVGTASVTAINTIVAGNTAAIQPNAGGAAFAAGSSNNVLNLSAALAGLSTLAYNGGSTQTVALLPGSPAINGGTSVGAPTTDQRGFARMGNTDVGAFEAQTFQPARLFQITINPDAPGSQRSRVTALAVTFDHLVSFSTTPAAGFQLQRQSDGKLVNLNGSVNPAGNVVTLTFLTGDAVDFGSLADGRYTLTIQAAGFASDGFDGNNDGTGGDDYQMIGNPANGLFRLFGDADGNGTVSATDFNAFRLVNGTVGASFFDFNGDNSVSAGDFNEFRLRYGATI